LALKILSGRLVGKGSVGSVVIEEMLKAVEDGVELLDVGWEFVGFIELVSPSAIAAFDGSIHLG
jgi:hypothetical protein